MDIKRSGSQPSEKGPAEHFTGTVRVDPLFQSSPPGRAAGAYVTFEPCARSDWHTHPLGQTIYVTEGVGRCQRRGGEVGGWPACTQDGDVVLRLPGHDLCGRLAPVREGDGDRRRILDHMERGQDVTRLVHDPFSRHVAWHHAPPGPGRDLDAGAMHEAAQALLGTHDFSSFGRVPEGATPVRNVLAISVERTEDLVVIRVTANAFIQQMVRSIVGTLVKVGEGDHPPGWVAEVLEARDRAAAGPVAPPHGLFLVEVDYPEELVRG